MTAQPTKKLRRIAPKPHLPPQLDPGDAVEFGTTIEVEAGGAKIWLRGAVTAHVRPNEDENAAWNRVTTLVQSKIDEIAAEYSEK